VHQALLRDDSIISLSMNDDKLMEEVYLSLLAAPALFASQFARHKVEMVGNREPRAALHIIITEVAAVAHRLNRLSAPQAVRNMLNAVREGGRQQCSQDHDNVCQCVTDAVNEMGRRHFSSPNKSSTKRKAATAAHNAHDDDDDDDDNDNDDGGGGGGGGGALSPTQANSPDHHMLEDLHEAISGVRNQIVGMVQQGRVDERQKAVLLRQLEDCCEATK
jgi:hypothetical protein